MSSQSKATRENQRKHLEGQLKARQGTLEKRGVAPANFRKDKVYQHLKARHEAIVSALGVIDELAKRAQPQPKEASKPAPEAAPVEKKPKKEKAEKAEKAEKPAKAAKAPAAGKE